MQWKTLLLCGTSRKLALKIFLLLFLNSLLLGSAAQQRILKSIYAYPQIESVKPVFEIPFETIGGFPMIRLTLNGHANQIFLIDTGSQVTAVSEDAVTRLRLKINDKKSGQVIGVADAEPAKFLVGKDIKISYERYDLYRGLAPVLDLSALAAYVGKPVSGILGFDILSQNIFALNYKTRSFSLYKKGEAPILSGHGSFDTISCGPPPVIHANLKIDGVLVEPDLKLDTGSNAQIELFSPFVTSHNLIRDQTLKPINLGGLGGEHPALHGTDAELLLTDRNWKLSDIYLSQAREGASAQERPDGTLGSPALEGHILLFKCPSGKIELH
jgi:hypothetical protein